MDSKQNVLFDQPIPFVIKQKALKNWDCIKWKLDDWSQNCRARFKFRVHHRTLSSTSPSMMDTQWENKALEYIQASIAELIEHVVDETRSSEKKRRKISKNLFENYPIDSYCFYSAYNHLESIDDDETRDTLLNSIDWLDTGLFSNGLESYPISTTLWIGTNGSQTPCHQDTYGFNFVAQIHGRKLWVLFSPEDRKNLYPTRIPFEESSVFSKIDFRSIDMNRYPNISNAKPYIIILNPGDLLYVPHHWWHYVENIPDDQEMISISMNTWIDPYKTVHVDNHIHECLAQILFDVFVSKFKEESNDWLNIDAELLPAKSLIKTMLLLIENRNSDAQSSHYQKPENLCVECLKPSKIDELFAIKPIKTVPLDVRDDISDTKLATEIIDCILHPDVIKLIADKLKERFQ
ncbi:Cdc20 [Sarcoptes scabiei]|nr:Cdc20 [Sarcoptes scabiei]